ncbi:MAG: hypothetical protein RLZZ78_152, partial [Armatimonadota bacterium]
LKDLGAKKVIRLAVSGGFHSPLMQSAATEMASILQGIPFSSPNIRIVANVTADWIYQSGVDAYTEFGTGAVLAGLVKRTLSGVSVMSVGDEAALDALFGGTL